MSCEAVKAEKCAHLGRTLRISQSPDREKQAYTLEPGTG